MKALASGSHRAARGRAGRARRRRRRQPSGAGAGAAAGDGERRPSERRSRGQRPRPAPAPAAGAQPARRRGRQPRAPRRAGEPRGSSAGDRRDADRRSRPGCRPDPGRAGLPGAGRDVQGHHPAAGRPRRVRAPSSTPSRRRTRARRHRQGRRHRGARLHPRRPGGVALGVGFVPVRKEGKLPGRDRARRATTWSTATADDRGARGRLRAGRPGPDRRRRARHRRHRRGTAGAHPPGRREVVGRRGADGAGFLGGRDGSTGSAALADALLTSDPARRRPADRTRPRQTASRNRPSSTPFRCPGDADRSRCRLRREPRPEAAAEPTRTAAGGRDRPGSDGSRSTPARPARRAADASARPARRRPPRPPRPRPAVAGRAAAAARGRRAGSRRRGWRRLGVQRSQPVQPGAGAAAADRAQQRPQGRPAR